MVLEVLQRALSGCGCLTPEAQVGQHCQATVPYLSTEIYWSV
jgi:hypothetical protein